MEPDIVKGAGHVPACACGGRPRLLGSTPGLAHRDSRKQEAFDNIDKENRMRNLASAIAFAITVHASPAIAEGPPLAHFPVPDARFSDALNAEDLAIEAVLNTAPDGSRVKSANKGSAQGKAAGTLFGSIRNTAGAGICGLVLVNGQFVFSCSPTG